MVKKIVFCGGDKREIMVMQALRDKKYQVAAYGFPEERLPDGVALIQDLPLALSGADVCILPQPPVKQDGQLLSLCPEAARLSEAHLRALPPDTPILCGAASPYLRNNAPQCRIFELAEDDRLAVPLSAASAEGAIAEAIALSDNLLCGAEALILGFGRIGREIAWRLDGLGMEVTVLNRGKQRRDAAEEQGYRTVTRPQLIEASLAADYIFNTVPAMLLDEIIIGFLHRETCIIDLAAYPGGTDFAAASRRGIRAVHAGGMPGKYASAYAGMIMAEFYPAFIADLLAKEGR